MFAATATALTDSATGVAADYGSSTLYGAETIYSTTTRFTHSRYADAGPRTPFTLVFRAFRTQTYSTAFVRIDIANGYGLRFEIADFSTAARVYINGFWSASPVGNVLIPWPGNVYYTAALTVDASLNFTIWRDGTLATSGTLTGIIDSYPPIAGPLSIAIAGNGGNYASYVALLTGASQIRAQELSANPWAVFDPQELALPSATAALCLNGSSWTRKVPSSSDRRLYQMPDGSIIASVTAPSGSKLLTLSNINSIIAH